MNKEAKSQYELHDLIKKRWSPRAFSNKKVEEKKVEEIIDAARWSASAFNEQPWRFIYGLKKDIIFNTIYDSLLDGNKVWTKDAAFLIVMLYKENFSSNNKINNYAHHDIGLAAGALTYQALYNDIYIHNMAGFDKSSILASFDLPKDIKPLTIIAGGYLGEADILPENLKNIEISQRTRKSFNELILNDLIK